MASILYIRLPCKPIYPGGVIALANYIYKHCPKVKQYILDLALVKKNLRKKILKETISSFNPDIIAFSWRDVQIFSPDEADGGLITSFKFYYGNLLDRLISALSGIKYLLNYRRGIKENLSYIKEVTLSYPSKRTVLGGGAVSVFSEKLINLLPSQILFVVGEGEQALLKVVSDKKYKEIAEKERVAYKDQDGLIHLGKSSSFLKLEDEEAVNFSYIASIFPNFDQYLKGFIGIATKRGCPHNCSYCLYNYIEGKSIRYRKAEAVLNEIKTLYFDFGVRNFHFTDSQFIPSKESLAQVEAILDGIISLGIAINWQGYLRIEDINHKLAKKLVRSGLATLELSIGSGSQKIVDKLRLGLKLTNVLEKSKLIKKAGFKGRVVLNYSLNAPYESKETLRESIDFYHQMVEIFSKEKVYPFIFFLGIQPHTELASLAIKQGHLKRGDNLLGLSPFAIKRLIYNPPPLNSLIAKSLLRAKKRGKENIGAETLDEIRRRLNGKHRI